MVPPVYAGALLTTWVVHCKLPRRSRQGKQRQRLCVIIVVFLSLFRFRPGFRKRLCVIASVYAGGPILCGWSILSCHDAAVREKQCQRLCVIMLVFLSLFRFRPGFRKRLCVIPPVYAGGLLTTWVVHCKLPRRSRPGEAASLCNNGCVVVSFQIQYPGYSDLVSLCVVAPVYAGGLLTTWVVCIKLP